MSWPIAPLKRLVDPFRPITYGIVQAGPDTPDGVPYIRPVDMTAYSGVLAPETLQRTTHEIANSYRRSRVSTKDIVVSIGPSFGKAMIVPASLHGANLTQGTARVAPASDVTARYLYWALQSAESRQFWESSVGGATFRALNLEPLARTPVPKPPLEEQRRIADFLDAETARIDRLAEARNLQRDLLESRRWSHFQYVLDRVPAKQVQLRRVLRSIIDGPFGSAFSSEDYVDDGAKVIRLGNIGFAEYRSHDEAKIPLDMFAKFRAYEVREGDLLIAGLGDVRNHAGRSCVAPVLGPAIVKGKCFRARLEPSAADAGFVALLLSSPLGAGAMEGRGSTRVMINLEIVKSAVLPIPELSLQRSVARATYKGWEKMRAAIDACDRQLDLLAERRAALITAVVTGRIDVSTASGRGIED